MLTRLVAWATGIFVLHCLVFSLYVNVAIPQLLSESFRFTLPLTPYRPYDPADIVEHRRVLLGMEGMVSDVSSLKARASPPGSLSC